MKQALDLEWWKLQGVLEKLERARADRRFREFISPLVIVHADRDEEQNDGSADVRITLLMALLSRQEYEKTVCRLQAGPLRDLEVMYRPWYINKADGTIKLSGWSMTFKLGKMSIRCGVCDMCRLAANVNEEEAQNFRCREFLPARSVLPGIARLDEAKGFVDRVRAAIVAENL